MAETLTIHWSYLLLAVVLLWFPRQWLRTGRSVLKKRRKPDGALERLAGMGARDPEDRSVQPGREFAKFRNYVDLLRAFAGGYCLIQFAFEAEGEDAGRTAFILQSVVLLVAVLVQSVRLEKRVSFFAALLFLLGMTVGTCGVSSVAHPFSIGHAAGLFAFALVLAINPVIPNPRWFLTAFGVLLLPFGFVLGAAPRFVAVNAGLILLTPLLSLLTKRPVVIFSRKAKSASP
jgi:hypothetical protein